MTLLDQPGRAPAASGATDVTGALRADAAREALGALLVLAVVAALLAGWTGAGLVLVVAALALYAAALPLLWRGLRQHPHARFGAANRVTLARLAAVCVFAGWAVSLGVQAVAPDAGAAWALVGACTLCALADALDGPLARASGLASAFGARFDLETDALLVLVLSALLWLLDKAGVWVLASGLLRHLFIAAATAWPWLAAPLPPSARRQTLGVLQGVLLITGLAPIVPRPLSALLAGLGLLLVLGSFAVDIRALWRRRGPAPV